MVLSSPQVIANPPVESVLGNVCGNWPGGAGNKICPPFRSVVGIVCMSVSRGELVTDSLPAGLLREVLKPKAPF